MRGVLVVVVNYRVAELCIQALESLEDQLPGNERCRVVVVDNASGDDSDDAIEAAIKERGWTEWARLVRSPDNGGYAAGNNVAILPALSSEDPPDYVLLLNPDTIARSGAIEALWEFLEQHPEVGIAGSRLEDADGTQHHSRYRFPSLRSEIDDRLGLGFVTRLFENHRIAPPLINETHPIDWVAGASMLIRRAVFESVGSLDPGYFLYFEEVDFCLRARRAGWSCWYVVESRVAHLAGMSSGIDATQTTRPRLPDYWFESRRRYWVKNYGYVYAVLNDWIGLTCFALLRMRQRIQGKADNQPEQFGRDLLRHSFSRGGA